MDRIDLLSIDTNTGNNNIIKTFLCTICVFILLRHLIWRILLMWGSELEQYLTFDLVLHIVENASDLEMREYILGPRSSQI